MHSLEVFVTGVTGKQGGALARTLIERGHAVRGLTRNPHTPAAQELRALGVELVEGGFDDTQALVEAARGADAFFAMSTPFEAGEAAETRQGIEVADAAKAAGVKHLVYNSVANGDRATGIPHFDSKARVETHVRGLGLPWTIVAPVFFMDNFVSPASLPGLQDGKLVLGIPPDRKLQGIAVEDIAHFDALAIEQPERFIGKRFDIASDERSGRAMAEVLSRVTGRPVTFVQQPIEQVRSFSEDFATMLEWFDRVGYSADIAGLKRDFPEVRWHSFEDWAKAQDWTALLQPAAH